MGEWVLQVNEDLMDFDIPCSFDFMRNKSKQALKNMVNKLGLSCAKLSTALATD